MFDPQFTITHQLLGHIKKVSEIISVLNRYCFSEGVIQKFEKRAREVSVFSSTSIEGNPLPLTDVKEILKNKPQYIRDSEKEVLNYNEALVNLQDLIVSKKVEFNLSLVLKVQKTVTQGLIPAYQCGKFREEPVFVNDPRKQKTIYWPPDQGDVLPLMKDLIAFIDQKERFIDPLILAGLFHKQFVIIHPFIDGNGRTARLVTGVLLAKMGLNMFHLFSFENYYNQNVSRYFEQVGVFGNYYDLQKRIDFTAWLEYFMEGLIDELLRVKKELDQVVLSSDEALKEPQQLILQLIREYGSTTDRQYRVFTKRAKPTRHLDFRKLIDLGIIEKQGNGKNTSYILKSLTPRLS